MSKSDKGIIMTEIILSVFRLGGALNNSGDRLAKEFGLTSARWKVLGALELLGGEATVAKISVKMGQARQGVQRIADEMAKDGQVEYFDNLYHKKAKLLRMTVSGAEVYNRVMELQRPWAVGLAENIESDELVTSLTVLRKLTDNLERD